MRRRHAYIFLDMLCAMFLVAALTSIAAIAVNRQSVVMRRLADTRTAAHVAESVLLSLQSGQTPQKQADCVWSIQALSDPAPKDGTKWVRVQVTVGKSSSNLVGLVSNSGGQP